MGAKLLPRDRTCTVGPKGKFLIRRVMCVTKTTGNESVLNLLETRKTRLAGHWNYSINHQSIAGRFSDNNIKENSLKHKNNTQQKTKTDKIMDIKYSSELTLSSFFIFLFSYSSRAATVTRSLIPLKPLYILSRNMNSVERLVIIQLVTGTPADGLNSKLQLWHVWL